MEDVEMKSKSKKVWVGWTYRAFKPSDLMNMIVDRVQPAIGVFEEPTDKKIRITVEEV